MPGDNFSRRVARAAAASGGRTYRAETPLAWYLILFVVCILGVSIVSYSRYEIQHPAPKPAAAPPTSSNEWKAAVAADICGKFVPYALPKNTLTDDPFQEDGDYIVNIQPGLSPQASSYEGSKATIGAFFLIEGVSISPLIASFPGKPVKVPPTTTTTSTSTSTTTTTVAGKTTTTAKGATTTSSATTTTAATTSTSAATTTTAAKSKTKGSTTTSSSSTTSTTVATRPGPNQNYKNGVTKCGSQPGYIYAEMWASPDSSKGTMIPISQLNGTKWKDGEMITLAFVPKGTTIPQPPASAKNALIVFLADDPSGVSTTTLPPTTSTPPISAATSTTVGKGKKSTTTTKASTSTSAATTTTVASNTTTTKAT